MDDLRTINIHGCKEEFVAKSFRVGDGVTLAIDEGDNRYILRYNEGIIDSSATSILSVAQMRNYGVNVEDKPIIYGGK